ncbi:MAG: hypothetical protein K9G62_02575 [Alphaproteobacteria bacterium]|nr:hypothetical protein [Alphaproteobacteria bacterium]
MSKARNEIVDEIAKGFEPDCLTKPDEQWKTLVMLNVQSLDPRDRAPYLKGKNAELDAQAQKDLDILIRHSADKKHYYDALSSISALWIREQITIPEKMRSWIYDVLTGKISRPKHTKAPDAYREMGLAWAARIVIEHGYPAGKRSGSDNDNNAFSIVVEAARKAGKNDITYNSVHDAYYSVKRQLAEKDIR